MKKHALIALSLCLLFGTQAPAVDSDITIDKVTVTPIPGMPSRYHLKAEGKATLGDNDTYRGISVVTVHPKNGPISAGKLHITSVKDAFGRPARYNRIANDVSPIWVFPAEFCLLK